MHRTSIYLLLLLAMILMCAGCRKQQQASVLPLSPLAAERKAFSTTLVRRESAHEPVPTPPTSVFHVVSYHAPLGKMAAYLSPDPHDGKRHPAIIWITGGDCNTIGDVWSPAPSSDDQTASAYRKAGIIMMFPSLRGGNMNPGVREGFYGEVDDVLAAAEYLASQPYVDPRRIYLGGHSTGGTLVLLVAECSTRFRNIFSFGPISDVGGYGYEFLPFDSRNPRELSLRSPGRWLHTIKSPVFIIEGENGNSNIDRLRAMQRISTNPLVHFLPVKHADHWTCLEPINRILAQKIVQDTGGVTQLMITEKEIRRL